MLVLCHPEEAKQAPNRVHRAAKGAAGCLTQERWQPRGRALLTVHCGESACALTPCATPTLSLALFSSSQVCTDEDKNFVVVNQKGIDPLSLDMLAREGVSE